MGVETVDSAGMTGQTPALAVDSSGAIHVLYHDGTTGTLRYATNAQGAWVLATVDTQGDDVGWWPSATFDADGRLHVGYYDPEDLDLLYTQIEGVPDGVDNDCDGLAW